MCGPVRGGRPRRVRPAVDGLRGRRRPDDRRSGSGRTRRGRADRSPPCDRIQLDSIGERAECSRGLLRRNVPVVTCSSPRPGIHEPATTTESPRDRQSSVKRRRDASPGSVRSVDRPALARSEPVVGPVRVDRSQRRSGRGSRPYRSIRHSGRRRVPRGMPVGRRIATRPFRFDRGPRPLRTNPPAGVGVRTGVRSSSRPSTDPSSNGLCRTSARLAASVAAIRRPRRARVVPVRPREITSVLLSRIPGDPSPLPARGPTGRTGVTSGPPSFLDSN